MDQTIAILGQGYVGLPLSISAVKSGFRVYGLDLDAARIELLSAGESFLEDVSSQDIKDGLVSKSYFPSVDVSLISLADIVVICVPTPLNLDGNPDLSAMESALADVARYAKDGTLIINESTSFPGTIEDFIPSFIAKLNPKLKLEFATAPERIDPGNSRWKNENTPRVVAANSKSALTRTIEFYGKFSTNLVVVSRPIIAELSKLLENTFRLVNISLVIEIANFCEKVGVDVYEVIEAANSKPYGFMKFTPGPGIGGHCIPIDPGYLTWSAQKNELELSLINVARNIATKRPNEMAQKILTRVRDKESKVLVAGVSYKAGVSDVRESPGLEILHVLNGLLTNIRFWDPLVTEVPGFSYANLGQKFDYAFLMNRLDESDMREILECSTNVIDCSGLNGSFKNIERLF